MDRARFRFATNVSFEQRCFVNADKNLTELVHSYGQNTNLIRQAIKDLEIRITIKTEQLEFDKIVLNKLTDKLAALDGADGKSGTFNSK